MASVADTRRQSQKQVAHYCKGYAWLFVAPARLESRGGEAVRSCWDCASPGWGVLVWCCVCKGSGYTSEFRLRAVLDEWVSVVDISVVDALERWLAGMFEYTRQRVN